ncbi:MAG: chromosomal replication initiator protein DnaA, partial [Verrucomicrobiota bacterium]
TGLRAYSAARPPHSEGLAICIASYLAHETNCVNINLLHLRVDIYTFETFVPGDNSNLAWAAAQAVAKEPAQTYQPLYFHSPCGLGKTHLLHAIGWESLRLRPKSKVLFVTAETFANDYINAIQNNSLVAFRKKYREADLLLLDDIQFLSRKEGMQNEFFHTFNSLTDRQRQIVLASDRAVPEITSLEDRLSSRFQWGLSAEIHHPGLEVRAAILRRKRDDWGMTISDDLINEIVELVQGNVRVLEGALIRVGMVSTMNEAPVRIEDIPEIIGDICTPDVSSQLGIAEIKRAVAEHYDVEVALIDGKKRTARVVEARQVAMYLIRTLTDLSLMDIAAGFGKDHGTVIHAVKKVKLKCETSNSLKNSVELIKRRLVRGGSSRDSYKPRHDFPTSTSSTR